MAKDKPPKRAGTPAARRHDDREHLYRTADATARNALATYARDGWRDEVLARDLLAAARALLNADRVPSDAVIDAMERCTAALLARNRLDGGAVATDTARDARVASQDAPETAPGPSSVPET